MVLMQSFACTGYFCPALKEAVKTMQKGEKALLTVKPRCKCQLWLSNMD